MKKWIIAALVIVLLILGGIYVGSPYYAIRSLRSAAVEANTDKLEASVDFPSVRDSLKSQLSVAMAKKIEADPEIRDNPFAGLGKLMMPAIVNGIVDTFVTPDGIAAMIRGQKPTEKAKLETNPDIQSSTEYVGLDRFRVRLRNVRLNEDGPSLLFERRGFASWKLIKLELPEKLLVARR